MACSKLFRASADEVVTGRVEAECDGTTGLGFGLVPANPSDDNSRSRQIHRRWSIENSSELADSSYFYAGA
jgi:hypothetical protein